MRSLILVVAAVAMGGCDKTLFVPDQATPGSVSLAVAVRGAESGGAASADRAYVRISRLRDSATVLEKIIEFGPADEIRLRLVLPVAESGAHRIQIELRRGDDLLFTGE